ncbi:MAG: hypothetical protein ABL958_08860 [Bdellovibrionia bacterium]
MKSFKIALALFVFAISACGKKTVVISDGSGSSKPDVSVSACLLGDPGECNKIHYIVQANNTPASDAAFVLGVYDAFALGSGVGLVCDTAADEAECLSDARAFLVEACENEVDSDPPIYARKYANPTSGQIHIDFDGRMLNLPFTEIICQAGQSRLN